MIRWRQIGEQRKRTYTGTLRYDKRVAEGGNDEREEQKSVSVFFCPGCMAPYPVVDMTPGYEFQGTCRKCDLLFRFIRPSDASGLIMIPLF